MVCFKKGAAPYNLWKLPGRLSGRWMASGGSSVTRVYTPNIFAVYLGDADFEQTVPLHSALALELEEHILEQADEKGFTLIGGPAVSFEKDQTLDAGAIRIESSFNGVAGDPARIGYGEEAGAGSTNKFPRIDQTTIFGHNEPDFLKPAGLYLTVAHGPDMGKTFSLSSLSDQQYFDIGRKLTNSILPYRYQRLS